MAEASWAEESPAGESTEVMAPRAVVASGVQEVVDLELGSQAVAGLVEAGVAAPVAVPTAAPKVGLWAVSWEESPAVATVAAMKVA